MPWMLSMGVEKIPLHIRLEHNDSPQKPTARALSGIERYSGSKRPKVDICQSMMDLDDILYGGLRTTLYILQVAYSALKNVEPRDLTHRGASSLMDHRSYSL